MLVNRVLRAAAGTVLLATAVACFPITEATERAWQENMPEALLPGYSGYEGLEVDGDIGWYLFTYQLPAGYAPAGAVPQLAAQIQHARSCFATVIHTETELQMRCNILTYGEPGYDEWRILVDPTRRKVTVMFGNLDSPVERAAYPELLKALQRAHTAQ